MSDAHSKMIEQIDYLSRHSGLGSLSESMSNMLIGINHRGIGNPVPYNQDNQGLTFFTRPRLNLSYNNLIGDRRLSVLGAGAGSQAGTYPQAIRLWLDTELSQSQEAGLRRSKIIDPYCAFIPLLSNNLISLSGWPDPMAEYYTAEQGLAKETWTMVDGVDTIFSDFQLQASFRNVAGDPISLMIYVWIIYMSLVHQGRMHPYPDSEMLREIDYQTRIYRLILDPQRTHVQKIAACGAAFPISPSLGQAFDFSSDTPFEQGRASQISVPFHCVGAMYQDPILIQEFNQTVCEFNPSMWPQYRNQYMVRVPRESLTTFNYLGYPQIDLRTNELQWWVFKEEYARRLQEDSDAASPNAASASASALPSAVPTT